MSGISEFVRKSVMGGYKAVSGGQSDPECSHVIMTKAEYDKMIREKLDAEREIRRIKDDAEKAVSMTKAEAEKSVMNVQSEAECEIKRLKQAIIIERNGKEYQIRLNENLLRMSRERANADRKIKPKKERSGYVVLSSRQKKYRYMRNRNYWSEVFLWETVIQTPYSVEFSAEQAMAESAELFKRDDSRNWLIGRLGVDCVYNGRYEDMIEDCRFANWRDYNVVVEKIFNANRKVGYWEVILTHTLPLVNISTEL